MSVDHKAGLQLRSLIKKSGELELSLAEVATPASASRLRRSIRQTWGSLLAPPI
jgi:hypothetical protein